MRHALCSLPLSAMFTPCNAEPIALVGPYALCPPCLIEANHKAPQVGKTS